MSTVKKAIVTPSQQVVGFGDLLASVIGPSVSEATRHLLNTAGHTPGEICWENIVVGALPKLGEQIIANINADPVKKRKVEAWWTISKRNATKFLDEYTNAKMTCLVLLPALPFLLVYAAVDLTGDWLRSKRKKKRVKPIKRKEPLRL